MLGLIRLAHQVEHTGIRLKVEIHVDLRPTIVNMSRHGVPHAAWLKLRHPENQLARPADLRMNHLKNRAHVTVGGIAQVDTPRAVETDFHRLVTSMSDGAHEVELRRSCRVGGPEAHLLGPHADIQRVAPAEFMSVAIRMHLPLPTQVYDPEFSTIEEIGRTNRFVRLQFERLRGRHGAADNEPIDMAVRELDFA